MFLVVEEEEAVTAFDLEIGVACDLLYDDVFVFRFDLGVAGETLVSGFATRPAAALDDSSLGGLVVEESLGEALGQEGSFDPDIIEREGEPSRLPD